MGTGYQNVGGREEILYKYAGNFARFSLSPPRQYHRSFSSPSLKVAMIAVFTAVSLGTNYAMIDVPNVKLMDALVFTASFLFGLDVGVGSAVSIWAIYGFVNPYGQADFVTLFFVMVGECFYALAGGLLRRTSVLKYSLRRGNTKLRIFPVIGIIGFLTTFAYDVFTNFGTWVFRADSVYQAFVIGMITGAPFAAIHEVSNLFFFAIVAPVAILASQRTGVGIQERRFTISEVKCPNCGAQLNLRRGELVATCTYCGYTSVLGANAPLPVATR